MYVCMYVCIYILEHAFIRYKYMYTLESVVDGQGKALRKSNSGAVYLWFRVG